MALVAILSDTDVCIVTDTLIRQPYQEGDEYVRPHSFVNKAHHLPILKSCFTYRGDQIIGASFYLFITQRVIGHDIAAIIRINPKHFADYLTAQVKGYPLAGEIYLFGFDESAKKMRGYSLPVKTGEPTGAWQPIEVTEEENPVVFFYPKMGDRSGKLPDRLVKYPSPISGINLAREVMRLQRESDGCLPSVDQIGIAGEMFATILTAPDENNGLRITIEHIYTWSDYVLQLRHLSLTAGVEETAREVLAIPVNPPVGRTGREN